LDLINRYNGIEYTRTRATVLVEHAKSHLQAFDSCVARDALETVADYVVSRAK
jgi:octaprenyl-diphosphate synthase